MKTNLQKTVYILAGGNDRQFDDFGARLARKVAEYVEKPRILSCLFSSPPETWQAGAAERQAWFRRFFDYSDHRFATFEAFETQLDAADVVYFHGGQSWLLLEHVAHLDWLSDKLAGKVVVGSSAGANMLSTAFWSATEARYGEGLGMVDKYPMVHYGVAEVNGRSRTEADWARERATFQARIGDAEITPLPEGQFIVVEADGDVR